MESPDGKCQNGMIIKRSEVPALRWVDVSDKEHGVSLVNDCRYAFDINGSTMRMTLLRGFPDMSPEADAGEHELHYALYPHIGPWRDAETVRRGWAFNLPLIARQALRRAGVIAPWGAHGGDRPEGLGARDLHGHRRGDHAHPRHAAHLQDPLAR